MVILRHATFDCFKFIFFNRPITGRFLLHQMSKPITPSLKDFMKQNTLPPKRKLPNVKNIIAVASGKGGVGKSTVTANLAICLSALKLRVGILDADVFGPSIPHLMNLRDEPLVNEKKMMLPLVNYGVKCMSIGFFINENQPVVWRGLMVMKALQQLIHQVEWGELDYLVIDMPPGTGDTQLTVTQQLQLNGAVIVSTPQDLAMKVANKGALMFTKVNVAVFGLVQNMSHFICPSCNTATPIFKQNSKTELQSLETLAAIPLDSNVCNSTDSAVPVVIAHPQSIPAQEFRKLAQKIRDKTLVATS